MNPVVTRDDLEEFLLHAGYTEPSMVEMRPEYPRIIRRLHERGYDNLRTDKAETELDTILNQMRMPEVRNPSTEHHLRNLTGVREKRQWKL